MAKTITCQPSRLRPSEHGLAGIPGKPSTQTGVGALTYTTSPPSGLLGVGLGGDSTPRMIAFSTALGVLNFRATLR
jgi:hypothetical protein